MPAKKTAPKSAKGRKATSRPAVRKIAAARKTETGRGRAAVHGRKSPSPPKNPLAHPPAPATQPVDTRKIARPAAAPPVPRDTPRPVSPVPRAARAAPGDGDDGEGAEPGSLLAGPRNVQPYIVKRGEQYMSKEQLDHFRSILNSWKRDLMVEVDRTVSHMKDEAANFPDPNDRATQEEEFSLEL